VACAVVGDVVSDTCDGWRGTSCVLINAPAAPCDCGVVVVGPDRTSEGDATAVGHGGLTAAGEGGGEGTAARAGAATTGGGVGAGTVCSGADGTGLVSCVRNSEEIGSIGVRGGIDCTGGMTGVGADSTTGGVGVLVAGAAAATGSAVTAALSMPGTRCKVVPVGREVVVTVVTDT
jgi:hypothetical protein